MIVDEVPRSFGRGTVRVCSRCNQRDKKQSSLVLWIVALDRPALLNAFNDDMYLDLVDLLQASSLDNSVAGIVFSGMGSYFSSGADLRQVRNKIGKQQLDMWNAPAGLFMRAVICYDKILAAAVHGPAVGIGVTLLPHCDLVWCHQDCTFQVPFQRLALVPELSSSVTFPALMGTLNANEMLLLGRVIDADTAKNYNLVSRVIPKVGNDLNEGYDPFHPQSLTSQLCCEIHGKLLRLPCSMNTVYEFISLIRHGKPWVDGRNSTSRQQVLLDVCAAELSRLDARFDAGEVATAVNALRIGSDRDKAVNITSKL
jgi:enoyl-CoA hydratase/carnithine racemase